MVDDLADLLGGANPCDIPEKELHKEQQRCKKCLVFSGVDMTIQVNLRRTVTVTMPIDILDRDIFDPRMAAGLTDRLWNVEDPREPP